MTTCVNCGHGDESGFLFCPQCGTRAPETASTTDSLLGRTLNGKYRVVAELGAGAVGTVYLGEHIGLKKKVALKILHSDLRLSDEQLQRFQREGIAAGKFNHPNAIQIFDFDRADGGILYLAMEFVEGSNLRVYLRQKRKLSVAHAIALTRQIVSCLAEAHRHGIVHRDLKPDNIMVIPATGGEDRVKVLDFGLSKLVDLPGKESTFVTQAGRILGTPLYMSPEQSAGEEMDARSDLYAVGLILYEMVSGIRPFPEETMTELLFARATKEAPSLLGEFPEMTIPEELDQLLVRCLQRRRDDRFQSATDLLDALDRVPLDESKWHQTRGISPGGSLTGRDEDARRSGERAVVGLGVGDAVDTPVPERRGRRVVPVLVGLAILAAITVGILQFGGQGAAEAPVRVSLVPELERTPAQDHYVRLLELARLSLRSANPTAARTTVNEALQNPLADSEAFLLQAEVFAASGDGDAAIASYEDALEEDPEYGAAHAGLGELLLARNRLADARDHLTKAFASDPRDAAAIALLGQIEDLAGDADAAAARFEEALAIDPALPSALLALGRLRLRQGNLDEAVTHLVDAKRASESPEDTVAAHDALGDAYLALDRVDDAEDEWMDALEVADSAGLRRKIGTILVDSPRRDEAERFLDESLREYRDDGRLRVLRGVLRYSTGDVDGAIDDLDRGVAAQEDASARLLLGLCYHAADRPDDAIREYERVKALLGEVPNANLGLALAYMQREQFAVAATHLEKVFAFDETSVAAHFHMGLLQMDYLGNAVKAREHFTRYLELGGTDRRVPGWVEQLSVGG